MNKNNKLFVDSPITDAMKRFGVVNEPGKAEQYRCFTCGRVQGDHSQCECCGRDPFEKPKHGAWNRTTPIADEGLVMPDCEHDWNYAGTDYHGSHKGEDAYKCCKCGKYEYRP